MGMSVFAQPKWQFKSKIERSTDYLLEGTIPRSRDFVNRALSYLLLSV